MEPKK